MVISAVSIFTFVYAETTDSPDRVSSSRFSDTFLYAQNSPITNSYEGNRRLGYFIFVGEQENSQYQWECLNSLWGKYESGWSNTAQNPYSTAYGIPQFLDGTWAGTGYLKTSDPETQIRAGIIYVGNRYKTACNALSKRLEKGWY